MPNLKFAQNGLQLGEVELPRLVAELRSLLPGARGPDPVHRPVVGFGCGVDKVYL